MRDELVETYQEVPYPSSSYPQTHPSRLAALAAIHGLASPPVDGSRVLEIGCADGTNLLPMAYRLPNSQFLGIDVARNSIETGRSMIEDLEVRNAELRVADFRELPESDGPFDYILAHGVFSWIDVAAQQQLLERIRSHLSASGLAYISYNTQPGWGTLGVLRDLVLEQLRRHAPASGRERMDAARRILSNLHAMASGTPWPFAKLLAAQIESLPSNDAHLAHDLLEVHQNPVSFREFEAQIRRHELQFVCEAEFHAGVGRGLPPAVRGKLAAFSDSETDRQEILDVLVHRRYRQSLVCHHSQTLDRRWRSGRLSDFHVVARLTVESNLTDPDGAATLVTRQGLRIEAPAPVVKAVQVLNAHYPASVPLSDLENLTAGQRTDRQSSIEDWIVHLLSYDAVDVHGVPVPAKARGSNHPRACPLAQAQAKRGGEVTNLLHDTVLLDEMHRQLLARLDGTRPIDAAEIGDQKRVDRLGQLALLVD